MEKGSINIDGISITVEKVNAEGFAIYEIKHTVEVTTLSERRVGELVNLENDIIGKYVEKLLVKEEPQQKSTLTREFLIRHGY